MLQIYHSHLKSLLTRIGYITDTEIETLVINDNVPGSSMVKLFFRRLPRRGTSHSYYTFRHGIPFDVTDYQTAFELKNSERHTGTYNWFIRHETFSCWRLTTAFSMLWFSGSAGVGESTLMAYAIKTLQPPQAKRTNIAVIYNFCDDTLNSTASQVLSVALFQLIFRFPSMKTRASKFDPALSSMLNHQSIQRTNLPSASRLWNLFVKLIQSQERLKKVYLVIDALNECKEASRKELVRLFGRGIPQLSILVSSRSNESIRIELSRWTPAYLKSLKLLKAEEDKVCEKGIRDDIQLYIRSETDRLANLRGFSCDQRDQIMESLLENHSGIFLAVKFAIRNLETTEVGNLETTLKKPIPELGILFENLLNDIPSSIRSKPSMVFKYLIYAREPLTMRQLAVACGAKRLYQSLSSQTSSSQDYLQGFQNDLLLLGPMLRVGEYKDAVQFFHPSVKEYLIGHSIEDSSSDHNFLVHPKQAQLDIAIDCLRMLISSSDLQFPDKRAGQTMDRPR